MTVSVDSWNTLRAYSPQAGCTGALGDLARAGDVASIANALEAGLALTGDSDLKVERFRHLMTLLTTENLRESERPAAENVVEQWYRQLEVRFPALLALGEAAENPAGHDRRIEFLMKIGVDPYERIYKTGFLHDDGSEFARDESAVECLLRVAADSARSGSNLSADWPAVMTLASQLLGADPIAQAAELPMRINLNHAIEATKDSPLNARYIDMDILSAAAVANLPGIVAYLQQRIDVQAHPETQEIYYRMGDLVHKLMGISFDDAGRPKYEPEQLPMAFHETDYQLANQLISYGAQFRQGHAGLEAAVARPVDRSHSAAFMAAHGWTTMCGSIDCEQRFLSRLLDEGFANANDCENGKSMLSCAVESGSIDMVEYLIERGADPRTVQEQSIDAINIKMARDPIRQLIQAATARAAIEDVINQAKLRPVIP